jgi:hypothetical protein
MHAEFLCRNMFENGHLEQWSPKYLITRPSITKYISRTPIYMYL